MSESRNVSINRLPSGVGKLDAILGGGWPEYSFNLIVGEPGCGKTTLAHQFMFANATPERPALYFTVLGEPTLKMLRYQQQFTFFDMAKVNNVVQFANLNVPTRVCQLKEPLTVRYSVVYQKVQSSTGSIAIEL